MKKFLILLAFMTSGLLGLSLSLYHQNQKNIAREPILETYHYPTEFVKQLEGDPKAGEKVYKEYCAACHAAEPIIEMNAPRINDKNAWRVRKNMGVPALLKLTIDGAGTMPARGGCFECSDEQLEAAIHYILSSQPN